MSGNSGKMKKSLRHSLFLVAVVFAFASCSGQSSKTQQPVAEKVDPYYETIEGKSGAELKTALFRLIRNPHVVSYGELWNAFKKTDCRPDGTVWDMYSDNPTGKTAYLFIFDSEKCGTYRQEGDCYNREHSVPKSWFKDNPPMYSDLFHIYPTDGFVNNMRGNLPFGEVGIFSWRSTNGSKVGQNTFGNYRRTVFEPIDAYKGDFARTYFYMATAYEDRVANWRSPQIGGSTYPAFSDWSLQLFLKWNAEDPVSEKERQRNEAVYKIQGNRNPYIDHSELVEYVWGSKKDKPFGFSSK